MKKALSLFLSLCLLLSLLTLGVSAALSRDAIADGYYLIGTHNAWDADRLTEALRFHQSLGNEGNDADIFAVQELLQMCGEEMFIRYNQLHWATPLSINLIREEALSKEVYLVYDEQDNLVASFNMSEQPSMYFDVDKKAMYFQRLGVVPSLWRRGIGTRILKLVEDRARKDGCECLRCTVYSESHHALWFLEKHGFETLYQRPSKHFMLLCMEKKL